ncbi:unnamed protein product [Coffea canephora]|uniref:DH200=94 genomic scaffold, scaffold_341 n=1 Tax=Coffea canephora TaxID=49390 RepID=A0A068V826_COFCA|nr:unnamed protein product [Coffea canephora]CDP19069.1 unnamed protein product [Coffea canephora]
MAFNPYCLGWPLGVDGKLLMAILTWLPTIYHWSSNWMCSMLQDQLRSCRNLVGNDCPSFSAITHTVYPCCKNKLGL